MSNFLEGGIESLEMAKARILEEASKKEALSAAETAFKTKEKELNSLKKEMEDRIASDIKEKRSEIKKKHDEIIAEADKGLKEAEKKKKDAKAAAVNDRVKNETAGLTAQNESLKAQNVNLFKANKVPSFCNNFFYYSLFAPKSGKNFLVFALSVVIALGVIPNVVCLLMSSSPTIVKVLVYALIVVIFVGIYLLFYFLTRSKGKGAVIEQGRANVEQVSKKNKEIKKIEKGIRADKDETRYGLGAFDDEIKTAQDMVNAKTADKETALKIFDEQTAVTIRQEIENEKMPAINELSGVFEQLQSDLAYKKEDFDTFSKAIFEDCTQYLGKEYMDADKIDSMIYLLKSGKVASITEAMDFLKEK